MTESDLHLVDELKIAGHHPEQAHAIVKVLGKKVHNEFVTKRDLKEAKTELHSEINLLRTEMRYEFALVRTQMKQLKQEILYKIGGLIVASFSALAFAPEIKQFFIK